MNNEKLAQERTTLADERTLLAYIRTALSLFIFGIAINKLYPEYNLSQALFIVSLIGGVLLIGIGFYQFIKTEKKIK